MKEISYKEQICNPYHFTIKKSLVLGCTSLLFCLNIKPNYKVTHNGQPRLSPPSAVKHTISPDMSEPCIL